MDTELIHVGFDNHLALNRVIAVAGPASAPMKRMVQRSKRDERAIDLTAGRRTKAVVVLDDDRIALVAITPETFAGRAAQLRNAPN
jgi:extracellular matrix regulatory protein A